MGDLQMLSSHRERILTDLKNIIKQVFHEAVNHELSPDNVSYITQTLLKRLEETLLFGLKNLQNGYWKIVAKILHPDSLKQLSSLNGFNNTNLSKCRAWICLSVLDDAFVSYMNCFVLEKSLDRIYEDWSILRHSDSCNTFLSLLSGIENVSFQYELNDALNWPTGCKLIRRLISATGALPWSPASSLTDSGVQLDRSDDYLNGNLPSVVLRRKAKDTQRHVSFHEDSLAKSPGRKLKWDVENSRYSWAGEDLDAFKMECQKNLLDMQTGKKRPKRIMNYSEDSAKFDQAIEDEINSHRKVKSVQQVDLPDKLATMLGIEKFKTWVYKLWLKVLVLTTDRVIILHKDLRKTILKLSQIQQVVVFPHAHEFHILTRKQTHVLRTGEKNLSNEILTRLAYQLHRNRNTVDFRILYPDDMAHVKQELIQRRILSKDDAILYLGLVRMQPTEEKMENDGVFKQDCVMYQTNRCPVWNPAQVVLRAGVLHIYDNSKTIVVNLAKLCTGCERSSFPDRPYTFSLTLNQPPDCDSVDFYRDFALRTEMKATTDVINQWLTGIFKPNVRNFLHFAVASEFEMSEWLQAIIATFCQGNDRKELEAEVTEASLLVTKDNAVLFTQPAQNQCGFRLQASALIQEIASFSAGSHPQDAYCIIELESMEASSATSDWVIHFGSREELEQARAILQNLWTLPQPFPFQLVDDARCERIQDCLTREWFA